MTPVDPSQALPFTVRPVKDAASLAAACLVRSVAYGSKNESYREVMMHPDAIDASPRTTVYLCERKADGVAVGSMRIQHAVLPSDLLEIERYVGVLPAYATRRRAEVTRLSAIPGADPYVRLALWKVAYVHAHQHGIALIMVGARRQSLIRTYLEMGYKVVMPATRLPYAGGLPHEILAADLKEAEAHWRDVGHPMLEFMLVSHTDISIESGSSMENRPEEQVVRIF